MSQDLHNEIMRSLGNLDGKVDGISQRLDKINGTLTVHNHQIQSTIVDLSNLKLKAGLLWAFATAFIVASWELLKTKIFK